MDDLIARARGVRMAPCAQHQDHKYLSCYRARDADGKPLDPYHLVEMVSALVDALETERKARAQLEQELVNARENVGLARFDAAAYKRTLIDVAQELEKAGIPAHVHLPGLTISYGLGDRVEQLTGKCSEALIQAQDLRDLVVQLNQELATSRAAHEVTAQERDRAVTELAMMRAWVEQARPVVEAVREIQHEVAAGSADAVGSLEADLEIMPLPPKEPK